MMANTDPSNDDPVNTQDQRVTPRTFLLVDGSPRKVLRELPLNSFQKAESKD